MDKVFLITYTIDDSWDIYKIARTKTKAEEIKRQLEEKIQNKKATYRFLYDRDYDKDLIDIYEDDLLMSNEKLFDEVVDDVYLFQAQHKELKFENILIEEKEVE